MTHYTLEPVENPPKENGIYQCRYNTGREGFCSFDCATGKFSSKEVTHWLRPLSPSEVAEREGEFAEWAALNHWHFHVYKKSPRDEWQSFVIEGAWHNDYIEGNDGIKTTSELHAMWEQEKKEDK